MPSWTNPIWSPLRGRTRRIGADLYVAIVAQARSPGLFGPDGVADTFLGRLELIMLHSALVAGRLTGEGKAGQEVARAMLEALVRDVDDSCRRIGVGDMGVPRYIKKVGAAVMERCREYTDGLATTDLSGSDPLAQAIIANLPPAEGGDGARLAARLVPYVRAVARDLAHQPASELLDGRVTFPPVPPLPDTAGDTAGVGG